eukprot:CAMPEP_0113597888 /NCGR_PEP_ID=MMETSP0015_2-20120614/41266_1 /TAXON_ID=2838 /ORGANISM="Odontella" /LENGTH=882 /DNA_ID=CAMNT_0000505813 /DNA_START=303 /DNA_END=2951 /DNA_ORIENTATION=- /assembly_acc=CAM_ASM_000160
MHPRSNSDPPQIMKTHWKSRLTWIATCAGGWCLLVVALALIAGGSGDNAHRRLGYLSTPALPADGTIRVFHAAKDDSYASDTHWRKIGNKMRAMLSYPSEAAAGRDVPAIEYRIYGPKDRRSFLQQYGQFCYESGGPAGNEILQRYEALDSSPALQVELWKYCMLYMGQGNAYIDATETNLIRSFTDIFLGKKGALDKNYAVLADVHQASKQSPGANEIVKLGMAHSNILIVKAPLNEVVGEMLKLLMETPRKVLTRSSLLLPGELFRLINQSIKSGEKSGKKSKKKWFSGRGVKARVSDWVLLESKCIELADPSSSPRPIWSGVSVSETPGEGTSEAGELLPAPLTGISRRTKADWKRLHQQLDSDTSLIGTSATPDANSRRVTHHCPLSNGAHCCEVFHPDHGLETALMTTRHPIGPMSSSYESSTSRKGEQVPPQPYLQQAGKELISSRTTGTAYSVPEGELQFMSTVREVSLVSDDFVPNLPNEQSPTPNFFDLLLENDCLPTTKACHQCLKRVKEGKGNDCSNCSEECGCYCTVLCKIRPPEKRVVKEYHVYPPAYRKDSNRLVPRIVHQTWFEPVTKEKYPNMSRLIESWIRSGWEYNFYDDDTAAEFLSTHFPSEVRVAYDSILPGAFKADLFRYCVLLIRGGIYADMDVLLTSNLDEVVDNDVGFMTPMDSPGTKVNRRSCLWNGLMAVAPGHPLLARTIEIVVNNIRNRFTSVDYDDMLCPTPVFHVSHSVDTLFTCGPCILGGGINNLLGRHMQDAFTPGDVDVWQVEREGQELSSTNSGIVVSPDDQRLLIPGRTIILRQNKEDMGSHRFTWDEKNMIVASTDMPDYDDRPPTLVHYSKTHGKAGVYGVKKLYTDNIKADEKIRIIVQKVL